MCLKKLMCLARPYFQKLFADPEISLKHNILFYFIYKHHLKHRNLFALQSLK